ncbi:type II secretion system minor pseudopilin GspI [Thalassococcus sp. BH17M4-6]|uniref:type II secretion system minor pseudopilin GspI n=1 Tax=Thalassococcus sp. BH17M4-6 TaxID=3413148 RepID=UPI003BE2BABA
MTRTPDAGLTLIETLVAMAVLAVGGIGLLTAVERHAAQTAALADRIAARWVAENELSALALRLPAQPQWRRMLGRDWTVTQEARPLESSGLSAVRVAVGPADTPTPGTLVTLTGYMNLQGGL